MEHGKRVSICLVKDPVDPEVVSTFERLAKSTTGIVNIHRAIANSPVVFARFIGLAHALRFETTLDAPSRELAILCVLERHHGEYELAQHRRMGLAVGLSQEQVDNVCNAGAKGVYDKRERAILQFAERFAADPQVRHTLEEDHIEAFLDNRQRIELSLTLALYLGLSHFTGSLEVPVDEFDTTN